MELRENSPGGTPVTRVVATDLDKNGPGAEDFGTVRYSLGEGQDEFNINPVTVSGRVRGCSVTSVRRDVSFFHGIVDAYKRIVTSHCNL